MSRPRFLGCDVVCMHNGPRPGIAVAEQNHTGFWLEGSVEPCEGVRRASSQFDLDHAVHCASTGRKVARQVGKV
jgi:hypothetical protein